MRTRVWDTSRKGNHLSKSFEIITEFTRSTSSIRIGKPVLMIDVKYLKTKSLADGLIVRTPSMLDEIESKTQHKDEEGDR